MIDFIKFKKEIYKFISFMASGVVSVAIDCIVYYILLNFSNIDFWIIQPISMSVGLCSSFLFNRFISFKNEKHSLGIELAKYLFVCALSISLSPFIIAFYYIWFGEFIVKIPATATTGIINYLLNRFFVYNDKVSLIKLHDYIEKKRGDRE